MKETKIIDGIRFYRYRTSHTKKIANDVANKIRNQGHYVRVLKTSKGYEIWVSLNPRWYYNWPFSGSRWIR